MVHEYFPVDLGEQFDCVVAQNVFGHVDDARGFLQGIASALARDGVAIIECPWVVDLVKHRRWDTIYHEHLSYWGIGPLTNLAEQVGLKVARVKHYPDLHGGTMRYYLDKGNARLGDLLDEHYEESFDWGLFRSSVTADTLFWNAYLQNPVSRGMAGYGASAKSSTFLNALPDRPKIVGIFDDNPRKWGTYTPGWHFPVLEPTPAMMMACDELINFAPNWDLEPKARSMGFSGSYRSIWDT